MFIKEVTTEFHGHQIAARNAWGSALSFKAFASEAKLYIDGSVVDTHSEAFSISTTVPVLRGSLKIKSKIHVVEVYARFVIRLKMKICIDAQKVAGDLK